MINPKDNTTQVLTSIPQDVTALWVDLGPVIDCRDIRNFCLWLNIDVNTSTGISFRVVGGDESTLATPYSFPIQTVTSSKVSLEPQVYEFSGTLDQKTIVSVEALDLVPYCKIQVKAAVVGITAGIILDSKVSFESFVLNSF